MTTFGFYQDAPFKIENEGREITIKLQKTSPTTAKITWTLPKGAPGCSIEDLEYNGIVIVVDNVPIKLQQTPENQTYYIGDPTVDRNLHAGDKIGTGLVVGAFYDDKKTTSLEISGLTPNTPYYVAGFAVNNVGQYHREGVHTYSQDYQEKGEDKDTAGCQLVEVGIQPTDLTNLNSSIVYNFKIEIDGKTHTINVNGSNAQTYQQLVDNLNYIFATLDNPFQGDFPPETGTVYVNQPKQEVYVWNGTTHVKQNAIVSTSIPTNPNVGDYWVDSDDNKLYQWNGLEWVEQYVLKFPKDPTTLSCGDLWFNGTNVHEWNGTVWIPVQTYVQANDPSQNPTLPCNSYWLQTSTNKLYRWKSVNSSCIEGEQTTGNWVQVNAFVWNDDPRNITGEIYWFNINTQKLLIRESNRWENINTNVVISTNDPTSTSYAVGTLWVNKNEETLFKWNNLSWVDITDKLIVWDKDPTIPQPGDLYFNDSLNQLFVWDTINQQWVQIVNFTESNSNPANIQTIIKGHFWYNNQDFYKWDGMQWVKVDVVNHNVNPQHILPNTVWFNTTTKQWNIRGISSWIPLQYITHHEQPTSISVGQYWYNPSSNQLFLWNGLTWIPTVFRTSPVSATVGSLWYNSNEKILYQWNGSSWEIKSVPHVIIDENGHLLFTSGTTGSTSSIAITDGLNNGLFKSLTPVGRIQLPKKGTDGISPTPMYNQLGVGTDGSSEERREMIEAILVQLGYPTVQVELTKQQLEFCVDQGLQTLRRLSSSAYERVYFFLNLKAGQQHYKLTDKTVGFHKVVNVMAIYRMTSAFLGTAEGQGVYGQLVLQHLYQMGTFDLVSYHIINEYIELMEKMFAANIMFKWNEKKRLLSIHQNLWRDERVLVDAVIERTEQDILADRYLNNWIQQWATAEALMILAEIRGKFSSLPGAGGGISLNSSDLRARAERMFDQCKQEIDDFIANNVEEYGLGGTIIMG